MKWRPSTETEIREEINSSWERMSLAQRKLWDVIKINPEKWSQDPWGNEGGGFWVVAIFGITVIWYNDIEEGFNRSTYETHGVISEYWCNQDKLEWTLQHVLDEIKEGVPSGMYAGPPQPIA
ncbi:MAG: hypothetical protein ABW118_17995 [Candidatus Thiodiazotropha sp.]